MLTVFERRIRVIQFIKRFLLIDRHSQVDFGPVTLTRTGPPRHQGPGQGQQWRIQAWADRAAAPPLTIRSTFWAEHFVFKKEKKSL